MLSRVALASVLAFVAAPAMAQAPDHDGTAAHAKVTVKGDPNRMICRREETTGSRTAPATKRCMTALQWAEIKQYDRQAIEQIQTQRYKND